MVSTQRAHNALADGCLTQFAAHWGCQSPYTFPCEDPSQRDACHYLLLMVWGKMMILHLHPLNAFTRLCRFSDSLSMGFGPLGHLHHGRRFAHPGRPQVG